MSLPEWIEKIRFDDKGLVPAIAQDIHTKRVVMFAFMNAESLEETLKTGYAVYWTRSRQKLWRKGEESGNVQKIHEIRLDCDADVLLLMVEQVGGIACHTGRESCFYHVLERDSETPGWVVVDPVLKDPAAIYSSSN